MIYVRTWKGDEYAPEDPTLQLTISGKELIHFQKLLARSLNTAAPEEIENKPWFAVADHLEQFLSKKD